MTGMRKYRSPDEGPLLLDGFAYDSQDDGALQTAANPTGLKQLCNMADGKVVLDIGANIGLYSYHLARRAKKVIAFEPMPRAFAMLCSNTSRLTNVEVSPFALGNKTGEQTMYFYPGQWGASSGKDNLGGGEPITVDVRKLDSFDLAPELIKIDVEGAELDVLMGGIETLKKHTPTVFCEIAPWCGNFGRTPLHTIRFMRNIGYSVRDHGEGNVWFIHRSKE